MSLTKCVSIHVNAQPERAFQVFTDRMTEWWPLQKGYTMAYLTIHRLDGDPDELLRRKQERFDPVVREHAGAYGALFSVTARTQEGLIVVNVWEGPEGAATFTQLLEIQEAQATSNLPMPSSFERFPDAQLDIYERETSTTR